MNLKMKVHLFRLRPIWGDTTGKNMDLSLFHTIDPQELPKLLCKAVVFGGEIEQPTLSSNRVSPIKTISIDSLNMIKIELYEDFSAEEERHIKIKLNYRKLFFHLTPKQYLVEGSTLITSFPKNARALALREGERYMMPLESHIKSSIYRTEKRGGNCSLEAGLFDFSPKGLGLMLQNVEEGALQKHDHIWIKSINNIKLENPIFGKVVYLLDQAKSLRVGVSLDDEIPDEIFRQLQMMSHLVLTA